ILFVISSVAALTLKPSIKSLKLGPAKAARTATMATTIINSITVNPRLGREVGFSLSLSCVSPAGPSVVQSSAFPEHTTVAFGRCLFRGAALVGDLAHAFFRGRGFGCMGFVVCATFCLRWADTCE